MQRTIVKVLMLVVVMLTAISFVVPDSADALTSGGGRSGGSVSSSSSSSSSARSSSSSMSHSQTSNQVRASQAQQASRQSISRSSMSQRNISKQQQNGSKKPMVDTPRSSMSQKDIARGQMKRSQQTTKPLSVPKGSYNPSKPYSDQWSHTNFYNNLLFYNLMFGEHTSKYPQSEQTQRLMLQNQMKSGEHLYTVTIKTKKGDRVIIVPKKDYDKVKEGQHVKYENGQLKAS